MGSNCSGKTTVLHALACSFNPPTSAAPDYYVFASPSTAAGVVQGRTANGRIDWKTKEGRTLKQLQETEATA